MKQVAVVVQYSDPPGGLPATWETRQHGDDVEVVLYLRTGLTQDMADHFRCMAVRDALPGVDFDSFTVTSAACHVAAVA